MEVYLENGPKRTFACSLDWPGWCRIGRTDADALAALAAYGPRYAAAVGPGWDFRPPREASELVVVERLRGGAGTDFGVPSREADADRRPVDEPELKRLTGLLRAAWSRFDQVAERAAGHELRKGPRGGGRDLEKIVAHVAGAEEAYVAAIGGSVRRAIATDLGPDERNAAVRDLALATLADRAHGVPLPENPRRKAAPWTARYFARRSAWHALDHAWEIEDRAELDRS